MWESLNEEIAVDFWERQFFGKQVLETMAAEYGAQILSMILELIRSRRENRLRLARRT